MFAACYSFPIPLPVPLPMVVDRYELPDPTPDEHAFVQSEVEDMGD